MKPTVALRFFFHSRARIDLQALTIDLGSFTNRLRFLNPGCNLSKKPVILLQRTDQPSHSTPSYILLPPCTSSYSFKRLKNVQSHSECNDGESTFSGDTFSSSSCGGGSGSVERARRSARGRSGSSERGRGGRGGEARCDASRSGRRSSSSSHSARGGGGGAVRTHLRNHSRGESARHSGQPTIIQTAQLDVQTEKRVNIRESSGESLQRYTRSRSSGNRLESNEATRNRISSHSYVQQARETYYESELAPPAGLITVDWSLVCATGFETFPRL